MLGFGAKVFCYDVYRNAELENTPNVTYTDTVADLLKVSEIISIHVPLMADNKHMINKETMALMPKGSIIINTSRGALIDTADLIVALKSGQIGGAGLDVYEGESEYFFEDKSASIIKDDTLARLMMFNNVIVTSHQAFLTAEALSAIANVTATNVKEFIFEKKIMKDLTNSVNLTTNACFSLIATVNQSMVSNKSSPQNIYKYSTFCLQVHSVNLYHVNQFSVYCTNRNWTLTPSNSASDSIILGALSSTLSLSIGCGIRAAKNSSPADLKAERPEASMTYYFPTKIEFKF
ncbi:hypothetical protein HK096_011488 [Nowakowskiella sp. JEL0078]|nr:hypothetical protein HK096_011488 [Nowakowskiella sp. JEL0078]